MKKKILIVLLLCIGAGGVFWANGGPEVRPEQIQREIPVVSLGGNRWGKT